MITRAHMRRQLYRSGGITNARQGYGLGSWVKEKVRKIIPNELADVASKAAPFVAPFFPGYAAAMRGFGRFDKRGSISDAMKQAALTYGGGRGARYLAGAEGPAGGLDTFSMDRFKKGPVGRLFQGDVLNPNEEFLKTGKTGGEKGLDIVRGGVEAIEAKVPLLKKLPSMVKQQLLVGGVTAGATALYSFLTGEFRPQEPGESIEEYLAARKQSVGKQMRTYMDNYFTYDPEYSALDDAGKDAFVARYNVNQGGRIGYRFGPGPVMNPRMAQLMDPRMAQPQGLRGLPSIPGPVQMAEDGPEYDMSERGGFQPLGAQEGKDDVKANLAKNEFVFTADAVRAAGGGSIEKGAQRMYDTMKKLESRVA